MSTKDGYTLTFRSRLPVDEETWREIVELYGTNEEAAEQALDVLLKIQKRRKLVASRPAPGTFVHVKLKWACNRCHHHAIDCKHEGPRGEVVDLREEDDCSDDAAFGVWCRVYTDPRFSWLCGPYDKDPWHWVLHDELIVCSGAGCALCAKTENERRL